MTAKTYDLYGAKNLSLEDLRGSIEKALGVDFVRHASDFRGGDYFRAGDRSGEHFVIQRNSYFDGLEEDISEPSFAEYAVLLQVNATHRGDQLKRRLIAIDGLDFLRSSVP